MDASIGTPNPPVGESNPEGMVKATGDEDEFEGFGTDSEPDLEANDSSEDDGEDMISLGSSSGEDEDIDSEGSSATGDEGGD